MDNHGFLRIDKSSKEEDSEHEDEKSKFKKQPKKLFTDDRYKEYDPKSLRRNADQWRMKERLKTASVGLIMCLNIGVDPPDIIKTSPSAKLECWIDPLSIPPQKVSENIGKALQLQYERWQPRARYKLCMDPTVEAVQKLCVSLRRNSNDERVLLHYNGHGVPRPTDNGEIWVFNKNYTQYIPLSIYDLQKWLKTPSIYVFDCNAAGLIVKWFKKYAEEDIQENSKSNLSQSQNEKNDYILLAACGANEMLPTNPNLPADIFTSCLTTPIKIALIWYASQTIISGVTIDLVDKLPGKLNDRRTPLGELNWIFTAVTDTIAWNVFPKPLFQKLFRQDLLVASLFRNFLLAERIMRTCRCTPISYPKLPPTYNHPMWQAWDLAVDFCLSQLPKLVQNPSTDFKHCTFFSEQLTAFEVWLEFGSEEKESPEQLPIVLQVLLSQQHRLRALMLLGRFLDLGPWAVNQSLSVGIFPYVLKLLQSPAPELREILVFIWSKILAVDKSCQLDLVKESGHVYFISVLSNPKIPVLQRTQSAFILSSICNNCRPGQSSCHNARLIQLCLSQLSSINPDSEHMLCKWIILCLAKLWENFDEAKAAAIRESAHEKLQPFITSNVPEIRATTVYALGTFIAGEGELLRNELKRKVDLFIGQSLTNAVSDGSRMVRKELVLTLTNILLAHKDEFLEAIKRIKKEDSMIHKHLMKSQSPSDVRADDEENEAVTIYAYIWKAIVTLSNDPYPDVATSARFVVQNFPNLSSENTKSQLYDLSCVYFSTPLMKKVNEDETSSSFSEKKWRLQRNELILREARQILNKKSLQILGSSKLEHEITILENDNSFISNLLFHPFEPVVVHSDEKQNISVWNWEEGRRLNVFSNLNSVNRITNLKLLNEDDNTLLAAGSDDGIIKIWSGMYSNPKLITSWRLLLDVPALNRGATNLVLEWQQENYRLFASGNIGIIRLWDLNKELAIQDIATGETSPVTCIESDKSTGGNIIIAGFENGMIRVYDARASNKYIQSMNFYENDKYIVNLFKTSNRIISGSTNGIVKFWDYRSTVSLKSIKAHSNTIMTSLAVHNFAPLIATGSQDQRIKVLNFDGDELSVIKYHEGFLAQRIGPVSSLTFHPYYILLGAGSTDNVVSIYASETYRG